MTQALFQKVDLIMPPSEMHSFLQLGKVASVFLHVLGVHSTWIINIINTVLKNIDYK